MSSQKISFFIATLINVNVVVGSAFFLGAASIAQACGFWAPLAWLLCGLFLVPLIAALSYFARSYPEAGGLYWYSQKTLGSFWGFVSGWGYFIGTTAGNAAVLKAFSSYLCTVPSMIPFVQILQGYGINIDVICVLIFALCSLCNITVLERLQICFSLLKTIPFLVLLAGVFVLADFQAPQHIAFSLNALWGTIPSVLFAYIGIEACCAIIDKIKDPERNGFRVLIASFVAIVSLYAVFQACIVLIAPADGSNPFLSILPRLCGNSSLGIWGNGIVYAAITLSFLGGFYGMFYFNNWHLHALAQDGSLIGSSLLTRLNKQHAPWVCVILQAVLLIGLLLFTSHNEYLLTMSDFGVVIAYLLTAVAFLWRTKSIAGVAALGSCGFLLYLCTHSLMASSLWNIVPFFGMLLLGFIGYVLEKIYRKKRI